MTSYTGSLSSYALRLVTWLSSRNDNETHFSAAEVANAIGSRRHVLSAIAETVNAGFTLRTASGWSTTPAFLESRSKLEAVGVVKLPDLPPESVTSPPTADAGSLELRTNAVDSVHTVVNGCVQPRKQHSDDLRFRQISHILGDRLPTQFPTGLGPAGTSISEGDTYVPEYQVITNKDLNTKNKEKKIYMGVSPRACALSETQAKPRRQSMRDRQELAKQQAKQVIARHETAPIALSLGGEADSAKAYGMAMAFEEAFGVYIGRPTVKYVKGRVAPGAPNFQHWLRAAQVADELGVDYGTFVAAQFWNFERWFHRAPKPFELGGHQGRCPAPERVRLYLEALQTGEARTEQPVRSKSTGTTDTTTSRGRQRAQTQSDPALRFQHSENQLRSLMKNYGVSEEEIFRAFAKGPNAVMYFDRQWLKQHPTFQRLQAAGEL